MPLSDIFRPELIKLELESTTRDGVFGELVETIALAHPECDRQEMIDALISRENRMSTAILPGLALPHGYCSTVKGTLGAVGFSRGGIEFNSPEPVYAVFMLLMDVSSREQHLYVLSRLLELFQSEAFSALQTAENSREAYNLLHRF
jgi:mannitol/fructose-specific phosphotransferase system IIA component (Ntr-type)